MRPILITLVLCVCATSAVASNKDNFFNYSTKNVQGQVQLRGHFGKNWTPAEVQKWISPDCKAMGKKVTAFQLGEMHKRKGQAFVAVCG